MGLRIGVIGAGKVTHDHLRAIEALGHEVVAACTRSPQSSAWQAFAARAPQAGFVPLPDILERPDIDAYTVGLSWFAMPDWLPRLLSHPKPMLLEKPIGVDSAAISDAIGAAGPAVGNKIVGFNRRFYAPVQTLKRRLNEGGLVTAHMTISENVKALADRWGRDILPHVLSYSTCHHLDLALYLLGPLTVRASIVTPVPGFAPYGDVQALMATRQGRAVHLSVKAFDPVPVGLSCHFDDGTVWSLQPLERLTVYEGYDVIEPTTEYPLRRYTPRARDTTVVAVDQRPGFLEEMRAFLADPDGDPVASRPADSLRLQTLIEDLRAAAGAPSRDQQPPTDLPEPVR